MQVTIDNINYKFIPSKLTDIPSIIKNKLTLKNDIYEKYEATAQVDGELIVCNDANLLRKVDKIIIRESYQDYMKYISKRDPKKDQWIYNIIEGKSEQEKILFKDELCIIIPTYIWDCKNIDKLHILCMPLDTNLRSIRSLNSSHIPLLEHMKMKSIEVIKFKYGLDENNLKIFFHYEPSTYHLHIHFVNVSYHECRSSVEYSHELNNVIFNLSICDDYYQRAILNKRI
jgi:diadenosine tetraphosphate (Ap4A) HIT family hydrolase